MVIDIPIVLDHPAFIVVNKPTGIAMHDGANGICHLVCQQLKRQHLYLVHRLDTPTSGCLLLAKTKLAASTLSQQFAHHQVTKYYLAISDKKPKRKQGKISGVMKKSRLGSYKLSKNNESFGTGERNEAITFFISQYHDNIGRIFYIKPVTGKTHQIRVALKSEGSVIIGDERYKGTNADRLYLHSHYLGFTYDNEFIEAKCLPTSGTLFNSQLYNNLRHPTELNWPKYQTPKV